MRAVGKKNAPPGAAQPVLPRIGSEHFLQRMLARAVQRSRDQRRRILSAYLMIPIIFGAGPCHDDTAPAAQAEGLQQGQAGAQPIEIFTGGPIFSRLGVPGEMQQMAGLDRAHQWVQLLVVEQIGLVPNDVRRRIEPAPRHGMNFEARRAQRFDCRPADKAARSGQQNATAHGKVSASVSRGRVRSAADTIGSGSGHGIASAGSSKATPRAASTA